MLLTPTFDQLVRRCTSQLFCLLARLRIPQYPHRGASPAALKINPAVLFTGAEPIRQHPSAGDRLYPSKSFLLKQSVSFFHQRENIYI